MIRLTTTKCAWKWRNCWLLRPKAVDPQDILALILDLREKGILDMGRF